MGQLHIISGDDDYAIKAKARELIGAMCQDENYESDPRLEIIQSDSNELKFDDIISRLLNAMRTPPFLVDQQIIWVRNFNYFDELSAGFREKGAVAEAAQLLTEPLPDDQTIIINGTGIDQRKAWVKAIKEAKVDLIVLNSAKSTDRNYSANRRQIITDFCKENGKTIESQAAQYLEEIIGTDTGTLHQELEKLMCYIGDNPKITLDDCRQICSKTPEAIIWNFTGALVERNTKRALEEMDSLIKQGDAELRLLATITNEFQQLVQVKLAMQELNITQANPRTFNSIPDDVREANPNNMLLKFHPFRAFKVCESAMRFNDRELANCLKATLDANRALVSGGGEPRIVLEQLIFKITKKP